LPSDCEEGTYGHPMLILTPFRRVMLLALSIGFCATALGVLVARGDRLSVLVIALVLAVVISPQLVDLPPRMLIIWPMASVVAYPFLRVPQQHSLITFDRLFVLALVPSLVAARPVRSSPTRLLFGALVAFTLAFGLRAIASGNQQVAIETWLDAIVLPLVLFLFARRHAVRVGLERVLGAFALAGVAAGAIALAERLVGFQLATLSGGSVLTDPAAKLTRYSGPFPHPEILAVCLLVCFALTLGWAQLDWRRRRLRASTALLLEVAGIGLTLFRSAWIAGAFVLIIALGLRPRRFGRLFLVTAAVATVAVAVTVQLEQNASLNTRLSNTHNLNGRFATYIEGLSVFAQHPYAGVGINEFAAAQHQGQSVSVEGIKAVRTAHSSYVNVLAEQGLLGFIPFIAVTVAAILMFRRLLSRARTRSEAVMAASLTAAAVAYLFVSLSLTILTEAEPSAFIAIVLGCAASILKRSSPDLAMTAKNSV
jgi:O-antigen ligase